MTLPDQWLQAAQLPVALLLPAQLLAPGPPPAISDIPADDLDESHHMRNRTTARTRIACGRTHRPAAPGACSQVERSECKECKLGQQRVQTHFSPIHRVMWLYCTHSDLEGDATKRGELCKSITFG